MKNRVLRLLALMLAAVVLLAGCGRYPHFMILRMSGRMW